MASDSADTVLEKVLEVITRRLEAIDDRKKQLERIKTPSETASEDSTAQVVASTQDYITNVLNG